MIKQSFFRSVQLMLDLVKLESQSDYQSYLQASAEQRAARAAEERGLIRSSELFTVSGHCYVCGCERSFAVRFTRQERETHGAPNWREHLLCPGCKLNSRLRACFQLFDSCRDELRPPSSIYLPEQRTPLYGILRRRFPAVVGSEYLGPSFYGGHRNWRGIRHEDLSRLSFPAGSFDAILCFEVLEHIADYAAALRECFRCLKAPGLFIFTSPFVLESRENITRARLREDGSVEHILTPEYHSDPFAKRHILCYHHFGWQLMDEMADIGFRDLHALLYWSRHFGYLGQGAVVFFARKE